jgi:hypothetical protein
MIHIKKLSRAKLPCYVVTAGHGHVIKSDLSVLYLTWERKMTCNLLQQFYNSMGRDKIPTVEDVSGNGSGVFNLRPERDVTALDNRFAILDRGLGDSTVLSSFESCGKGAYIPGG